MDNSPHIGRPREDEDAAERFRAMFVRRPPGERPLLFVVLILGLAVGCCALALVTGG